MQETVTVQAPARRQLKVSSTDGRSSGWCGPFDQARGHWRDGRCGGTVENVFLAAYVNVNTTTGPVNVTDLAVALRRVGAGIILLHGATKPTVKRVRRETRLRHGATSDALTVLAEGSVTMLEAPLTGHRCTVNTHHAAITVTVGPYGREILVSGERNRDGDPQQPLDHVDLTVTGLGVYGTGTYQHGQVLVTWLRLGDL